ncbi:MAG TPA: metal ABC transporter substrate-binding protein [Chthoniobacterales bacterium]|nr:metal ABC transporter substrate-binding protein [Chthoniobacterales bacterium]
MKRISLAITSLLLISSLVAQAKLKVVATFPDLGSLARDIGKEKIDLVVLGKPSDDPHFLQPRPNFVASLRDADVLIEHGADLELGWLSSLLQKANNSKINIGKPGRIQASQGISLINSSSNVARSAGDEHARGNPHFVLDPMIAKSIAQHIAKSLATVDPPNAAFYDSNYKKFEAIINAKVQGWRAILQPYQDQHVVAYHDSWPYFAHRFGLKIDVFFEESPGIPPAPSHLTDVIQKMKENHIKAILVEPYQDRRLAEKIARSADATVIDVAEFPGGIPGTDSYVSLVNQLVKRVADAVK